MICWHLLPRPKLQVLDVLACVSTTNYKQEKMKSIFICCAIPNGQWSMTYGQHAEAFRMSADKEPHLVFVRFEGVYHFHYQQGSRMVVNNGGSDTVISFGTETCYATASKLMETIDAA
jgi:sulfur relay (sulfurtransferase) DsrF/TusC family protein